MGCARLGSAIAAPRSSTPSRAGWDPTAESRHAQRDAQDPAGPRHRPASAATIAGDARSTGIRCGGDATSAAIRRSAANPAACGPASSSCSGGCTRDRTISARPSAVKPSSRGRSGSSASAACRPGASAASPARPSVRRNPPGSRRTGCAAGSAVPAPAAPRGSPPDARPPCPAARPLRHRRRRRSPPVPAWDECAVGYRRGAFDIRLRQRLDLFLDRSRRRPWPRHCTRSPSAGFSRAASRAVVDRHRQHPGAARANSSNAPGPRAGGHLVRRQPRRQPRTLAALRGARDANRHEVALTQTRAALAVGQEPLGAVQRQKAARHRGNPGDHPAAMKIANTVRLRRAARSHSPAARHRAPRRPAPRRGCRRPAMRCVMATASPARAAAVPSRTAAGRRRWNSCRTGSG